MSRKKIPYVRCARLQDFTTGEPEPNYFEMQMMKLKRQLEAGIIYFWTHPDYPERRAIAEGNGDLNTKLTDGMMSKPGTFPTLGCNRRKFERKAVQ